MHVPIMDHTDPINVKNIPMNDIIANTPYFLEVGVKVQDISKKKNIYFYTPLQKKC